ncbi:LON peptidase substrate-binding domain-containing protein [Parasphingopyxis marina]|uniref:LON peptidase substrate-binding domain-containing protein n=1 Tax=Parasphingopyxis marina TaxID=2761622 RepID=A0A842HTG2_9SPHN|nr:LON peptidase substrate-binding domain-containing protein [Parasphingopyxis marina]MBC2776312.1 LON peptidase substrate-binding domain-containing protein [Parasphingopyxis marina]
MGETRVRLSIFPLAGAILLPRAQLPLHIFEMRYRALVKDAMARDRRIAMIQPREPEEDDNENPPLFEVGCVGKVAEVEALDDGRFNVILEGVSRFRVIRELDVTTPFRQIEGSIEGFGDDIEPDPLSIAMRGGLFDESRKFATALGYAVDWDAVQELDDEALVNMITQVAPFDIASKQALLEAASMEERSEMLIQFMEFFRMHQATGGDDRATLQ